ncbi:NAD(P)H-dependent oxidoreductase [Actinomadura decatromicini]|uniref:NAD(P)H-dependent oxidoreductase n=1 Tax=Actinomadura decatromicini TaxID=2604572 RepID=A0A5D3F7T9_9ACTN|nr:NAD(P)H-dependent oxidoreductase [Actinomadura decatromicini]TYK44008.1 NAD(P)H-dependent oxidoreductase [Actinomadura decatromicini]
MNVLWVFAHPEPRSLNGALRDHGAATLRSLGHRVRHSDLYAMGWNPVVGPADFGHDPRDRLVVGAASERAHAAGTLASDIRAEHDKIAWADALVVQFPLWWFGMPAILKGWFDRVFVQGFAFGVTDDQGRTLRYGDGGLAGRRALVITTAGARPTGLGPRGVHGEAEDVLFPLLHGTLFYTGMDVLPPLVIASADRARPIDHAAAQTALDDRLRDLPTATPIPYRAELGGDYDADLVLRPDLAPARTGLTVHRTDTSAQPAPGPGHVPHRTSAA